MNIMKDEDNVIIPYFDLEEICKFVTYSDKNKTIDSETISNYDVSENEGSKYSLVSKSVSERTIPSNAQIDTIRYDLVKTLMLRLIDGDVFEGGNVETQSFTFGAQLAITTLKEYKMLKI